MDDIDKLRYDLALNCALITVLNNKPVNCSLSSAMVDAFQSAYKEMCDLDVSRLKTLQENMLDSKRTASDCVHSFR